MYIESSVDMKQPCILIGFDIVWSLYSISPFPSRFSAPVWSKITLESIAEGTAYAILPEIFDFIKPVITVTTGFWVASIKCIPTALPICAILWIFDSTSGPATSIKSAISSITIIRYGIAGYPIFWLYWTIFLARTCFIILYLFIISFIVHSSAFTTSSISFITGVIKWGIPLYASISTIFGSTSMSLSSSGVFVSSNPPSIEFIPTDFPALVIPATSKCGILTKSLISGLPVISLPSIRGSSYLSASERSFLAISFIYT